MKKLFKTIVCLAIAVSLCIAGTSFAWASESSGDSSGEFSLNDLLSLLTQLAGDEEESTASEVEEETEPAADDVDLTTLTIGSYSFDIPTEWYDTESEDDGIYTYYAPDYSKWITINYADGMNAANQIDPNKQEHISMIKELLGGGESVDAYTIKICGTDSILIAMIAESESVSMESYSLIIPFETELLMLSVAGLTDCFEDLLAIIGSFDIEGADGETDLSGIYSSTPASSEAETSAASSSTEALEASETGEVIVVDDDICTVSIKNFSTEDSYYPLTAKVFIENKTDINLYVSFDAVSVNGYMCNPWFGTTVSAGHKSNSELHFRQDDFDTNQISEVRDIEFTLMVRDDDDYSADPLEDDIYVVYPFGTDVPEQPPQEFEEEDLVIEDNDDFTMVLTDFDQDDNYVYGYVYLKNKTDKEISFRIAGDSTVNGYEISPFFYKDVMPGKMMNTSISWSVKDLLDNDIETIEYMELDLVIRDANDWYADPIYEDIIYLTF